MNDDTALVNVQEAAEILFGKANVSTRRKVWWMCREKILPRAFRIGETGHWMIPRADVEALRQ
jgi:hypothetical protein